MSVMTDEYTVTMGSGASGVVRACVEHVTRTIAETDRHATTYAELVDAQRVALDEALSLLQSLSALLTSTRHDGDVTLRPDDSPESIAFRRARSGYSGAMIRHDGRWSVYT
jgi:hypothetical protein